jgi:hypothetical protein
MDHIEFAETLEDLNHDCKNHLQLCVRNIGDKGNTSYVNRCTFCGEQIGNAISKSTVEMPKDLFDVTLKERYWERRTEFLRAGVEANSSGYVHPLPYENFENNLNEFIANLSGVDGVNINLINGYLSRYLTSATENQRSCYQTPFGSEEDLHIWLSRELSRWFYVYSEVHGVGYVNRTKKNVRLDLIIKAKPELISTGFTDKYIGIEIKYLNPGERDGFHKRSSRGVFQALSYWYSGARWNIEEGKNVDVCTVLFFSDISFTDERNKLFDTVDKHYKKYWNAYLSLANHGNVGELIFDGSSNKYFKWRMDFAQATYFTGYANGDLRMGNPNLINKIRIGSTNS